MHHLHGDSINHLQNKQWLDALDATFATNYFSKGRGSIFGESLYRPIDLAQPETCPDTQQLNNDLQKLIGRTKLRLRT